MAHEMVEIGVIRVPGGSLEILEHGQLEIARAGRTGHFYEEIRHPHEGNAGARSTVVRFDGVHDTVEFAKALKARGCAAMHASTGGVSPLQSIKLGPGYQVPYAKRLKADVGLPTIAVGLITEPEQAEAIIASGEADAVSLARAMLYDPRWPWHAAAKLGARVSAPPQYWRSQPREFKDLFEKALTGAR